MISILCVTGLLLFGSVGDVFAQADGWVHEGSSEDSGWYYYENGSKRVLSWVHDSASGSWYYVDENGTMVRGWGSGYAEGSFFDKDGVMVTGWVFLLSPAEAAAQDMLPDEYATPEEEAIYNRDGNWYYFGSNGVMAEGWTKLNGNWCYFGTGLSDSLDEGAMATGVVQIDDGIYCFSSTGAMRTGLISLDSGTYYFGITGKMQTAKTIYYVRGKWTMTKPTAAGRYSAYVLGADGEGISTSVVIE